MPEDISSTEPGELPPDHCVCPLIRTGDLQVRIAKFRIKPEPSYGLYILLFFSLTDGICPSCALVDTPSALEMSSKGTKSPGLSWTKWSSTFSPPLQYTEI